MKKIRNSYLLIHKALGDNFSRLLVLIILCAAGQLTYAQTRQITGTVSDEKGELLIGVTVMEQGTTNGTITNYDGEFTINVPDGATIEVRFIGFAPAIIPIGDQSDYKVVLKPDNVELDDVVVVGYGQQKKESVVGAISAISSDEILKSSSPNITQAISGKLPGVITSQASGAPGSDDMNIYIRGQASFAGDNQPLVMVDGVEREFSQIAPDDIESISVLKDASATAVYGVRGANGVILVTTRRGTEQKPIVSMTANYSIQSPTRHDKYLNSYQSVQLLEEALGNDDLASQYDAEDIEMFRQSSLGNLSAAESQLYPNVDWYDQVLNKTAPAQRYNLNVVGGTKRLSYFVSLEYYNQSGLYKNLTNSSSYDQSSNAEFNRYSFRANLDYKLTNTTTLSVNFGTRFEERNGPNITENSSTKYNEIFYELNHSPGWLFPVQYENGYYGGNSQHQNNIVAKLAKGGFYRANETVNETNFILNQKLDIITEGLSFKGMVSYDYDQTYDRRFYAGFATYELIDKDNPDDDDSYTMYNEDEELSNESNDQTTYYKLYMEYALNYSRTFKDKHSVTGLLLYNQQDYRYMANLQKRYQGFVGRVTYDYDSRYFAEFNGGYNGSENFKKGHRFGFFPSISAGWYISNESFMDGTSSWLDKLKVRASYGQVGNDKYYDSDGNEQRFLYVDSWSWYDDVYYFGSSDYVTGVYEGTYPNYGVTWERANKYNIALESNIKNGMLSANVDLFMEKRKNILTEYLTIPEYYGVDIAAGNLGETTNKGYEIELKHNNTIGEIHYNLGLNFTHAKNSIDEMDEPDTKPAYLRETGHSIGQFFGLECEGFITQEDIDSGDLPTSSFSTAVQAGDLKYKDQDGDGYIDDNDITQIGYSEVPQNTYGFSAGIDYKGWAFSFMLQGVDKVSRYYDDEANHAFVDGGKVREEHLNRWDPNESDEYNLAHAKYPLLHYDSYGNHNQQTSSFFLKNGNFLRLKNIELSYTLPKRWVDRIYMSSCRVYVNANNLVTWDKLDGLVDPESSISNAYPIMKSVSMGVNVKF